MQYGFGMCSTEGDKRVLEIAVSSKTYAEAEEKLVALMQQKGFEEAFDTEVRAALVQWFASNGKN